MSLTRRGVLLALFQSMITGSSLKFIDPQPKEYRISIQIPLVITDGKTEVRYTPEEIMEALKK
jgi:hypothetical protein